MNHSHSEIEYASLTWPQPRLAAYGSIVMSQDAPTARVVFMPSGRRGEILLGTTLLAAAGAFGSYIDVRYAMILGMIPDCDLAHVASAGNAAGTGARITLLSLAARNEIEATVRAVEKLETAIEPDFQDFFVNAMSIPHAKDRFPNLARCETLPSGADIERVAG